MQRLEALSPLGERVARSPDALHREAGRVRGSRAWDLTLGAQADDNGRS